MVTSWPVEWTRAYELMFWVLPAPVTQLTGFSRRPFWNFGAFTASASSPFPFPTRILISTLATHQNPKTLNLGSEGRDLKVDKGFLRLEGCEMGGAGYGEWAAASQFQREFGKGREDLREGANIHHVALLRCFLKTISAHSWDPWRGWSSFRIEKGFCPARKSWRKLQRWVVSAVSVSLLQLRCFLVVNID